MIRRLSSTLILIGLLAGCTSPRSALPAAAPDLGRGLAAKVTADGMFVHLRALQDIANANKGNRAEGTPGYDASVDYVAKTLRGKGFDVATPQFDRLYAVSPGKPSLTIAGSNYSVDQASLLVRTPPGGLTGQPVRPGNRRAVRRAIIRPRCRPERSPSSTTRTARWSTSRPARRPRVRRR